MPIVNGTRVVSDYRPVHVPDVDIWQYAEDGFKQWPQKTALIDPASGREMTYKELHQSSLAVARGLLNLGYKKSEVLAIYSPNCVEYPVITFAVLRLGGKVCCLNPLLSIDELRHELDLMGCTVIVSHQALVTTAIVSASGTKLKTQIVIGKYPGCTSFSTLLTPKSTWPTLPDVSSCVSSPRDQTAMIFFSSGTTGLPKGVMISHRNIVFAAQCVGAPDVAIDFPSPVVVYQPFSHIYGMAVLLAGLVKGRARIPMPRFDLDEYIRLCSKYKCEALTLVPPVALLMCMSGIAKKYDLSNINTILIGAAPLPAEVEDGLVKQFAQPVEIRQGYGLTETTGLGAIVPSPSRTGMKPAPFGSVGLAISNSVFKVVDLETRKELGPNQSGEILFKSDGGLMQGYYMNEEATKNTFTEDGFLCTGDIGHFDEDGFVFVVDRLKELIKYKGFQVAPAELEALLLTHPAIADCGVTGIPDLEAGELPLAWIVLKPGQKATEEEIHKLVSDKLAPYKKLRGGIKFVTSIPKSPSGKILRREVKRLTLEEFKSKL